MGAFQFKLHMLEAFSEPDAFVRQVNLPGQTYIPWLKKDEIGVSSFPTLFTVSEGDEEMTKRTVRVLRRKVRLLRQTN